MADGHGGGGRGGAPVSSGDAFWEREEQIEKFASRDPDRRLRNLLSEFDDPETEAALDLGCAGGRNAELLARTGVDVWAVDTSRAMVEETRRRLAGVLGPEEARRRVRRESMTDLSFFADGAFDLVVALGVYHNASSPEAWERALEETRRVLAAGGRLLVANFAPGTDLTGEGVEPVPATDHLYAGAPSGPLYLLAADELDTEMKRRGLRPAQATEIVAVDADPGRRVTVNGLYEKVG